MKDAYELLKRDGCSAAHPVLSSSTNTCDCVNSNYHSSSCVKPAQSSYPSAAQQTQSSYTSTAQQTQSSFTSTPQQTSYLPMCENNSSKRFSMYSQRKLGKRNNKKNNSNKKRGCKWIGRNGSRAKKWCNRSGAVLRYCKETCSTFAGKTYTDCRPSTG